MLQMDCLVCSHCFRFIGSVELQIGRKLFLQNLGDFPDKKHEISNALKGCSDHEDESDIELDEQDKEQCGTSGLKDKVVALPKDLIDSLMNGSFQLPYSDQFQLPLTVSCPGGCQEAFYCRCMSLSPILIFL